MDGSCPILQSHAHIDPGRPNWLVACVHVHVCCSSEGGAREPSAKCGGHAIAACGELPTRDHASFRNTLHALITKKQANSRDTAAKGHQANPAFICSEYARGGFTDAGQHTGSRPRGTAWPLVREVLQVGGAGRDKKQSVYWLFGNWGVSCSCLVGVCWKVGGELRAPMRMRGWTAEKAVGSWEASVHGQILDPGRPQIL